MKKNLLIVVCLFLSLAGSAFSAEAQNPPMQSNVSQKACQNVFSFINLDVSLMSPRAAASDVSISDIVPVDSKKSPTVAVSDKKEVKQLSETPKNKTSLFRLDLLHIFKIQIL